MSKGLPLLCQNVTVYRGPYVPCAGLRGSIGADGLKEGDVIHVVGVTAEKHVENLGELTAETAAVIFNPTRFKWVRAFRAISSGSPIDVWVR